jgi:hypothetical protein
MHTIYDLKGSTVGRYKKEGETVRDNVNSLISNSYSSYAVKQQECMSAVMLTMQLAALWCCMYEHCYYYGDMCYRHDSAAATLYGITARSALDLQKIRCVQMYTCALTSTLRMHAYVRAGQ